MDNYKKIEVVFTLDNEPYLDLGSPLLNAFDNL